MAEPKDAAKRARVYDYMRVADDKVLRFNFTSSAEAVRFSDNVVKINRKDKRQKRLLVVTNYAMYNFNRGNLKKCKWKISLHSLSAVVISKPSQEIVFQVDAENIRYEFKRRAEVLETVAWAYHELKKERLSIFFSEEKHLREIGAAPSNAAALHANSKSRGNRRSIVDVPMVSDATKEGWLSKRKGRSNKWEVKFFRLAEGKLQYFTYRIKGTFSTESCSVQVKNTPESSGAPGPRSMELTMGDRRKPLVLSTNSEEGFDQWVLVFQTAANKGVRYSGWLDKADNSRNWKRRYFTLHDQRLWMFDMTLKNEIVLGKGVRATPQDSEPTLEANISGFAGLQSTSRYAYRFVVSNMERVFMLAADSQQELDEWVEVLERIAQFGTDVTLRASEAERHHALAYKKALQTEAPKGQVTCVFTDVQSSTKLWEAVPDAMNDAIEMHDRILRDVLDIVQGYEVKTEGDAFFCSFSSVWAAMLWCIIVQKRLVEATWPEALQSIDLCQFEGTEARPIWNGMRVRMGIHTGYPTDRRNPITGRMDYFGPDINLSARVSDTAHGGQIVCTLDAHQEFEALATREAGLQEHEIKVKDISFDKLGDFKLKGIADRVPIYNVTTDRFYERAFPPIRAEAFDERVHGDSAGMEGEGDEDDEVVGAMVATSRDDDDDGSEEEIEIYAA